jgi:beta-aspartyl-peptidase (threonine type)
MTVVVVHGGAGAWPRPAWPGATAAVARAARAAHAILAGGGSALDAAIAAVVALEDDPRFNAGHGAVATEEGEVELDAAVMDGATGRIGAVAVVRDVHNPVLLARAVLDDRRHALLAGQGAERFADDRGLRRTAPGELRGAARHGGPPAGNDTVGAVALDRAGWLAAATSTGGVRGQRAGRVGDAPLPGCGTWADARVAVTATGTGERLIEAAAAHEVAARVRLAGEPLDRAAAAVIGSISGDAGLVAVDAAGAVALPSNTAGMPRAVASPAGVRAATGRGEPLASVPEPG